MVDTIYLNGTSGNDDGITNRALVVDSSAPYVVNGYAGNDLIKISIQNNVGGTYIGYGNSYTGGAGNDTIEITGSNAWAAFTIFSPMNSVETIKGDGPNDVIVAGYNTATNKAYGVLDLSATTLVNIAQIRGTGADDDITGSAGADNIFTGDGSDTIRESGGADIIDGGTGTNIFIAKGTSTTYSPGLVDANGNHVYNIGTSWEIIDSTGTEISLKNLQTVVFTDKTLLSSSSNTQAHATPAALNATVSQADVTKSLSIGSSTTGMSFLNANQVQAPSLSLNSENSSPTLPVSKNLVAGLKEISSSVEGRMHQDFSTTAHQGASEFLATSRADLVHPGSASILAMEQAAGILAPIPGMHHTLAS